MDGLTRAGLDEQSGLGRRRGDDERGKRGGGGGRGGMEEVERGEEDG